jgi:glycosyltransferase involved in cell wall biosynthesis
MDLSFIIPAYNEADNIEDVIDSIKTHAPAGYRYEVLVVDHGSIDNTLKLAETAGAKPLLHPEGTIAQLRNHGVTHSTGKVLIFLDADIRLTHDWTSNITPVATSLTSGDRILTGSWYSIPDDPNWIEKYWFKPLERGDNSHINSGHLIISRQLFDEINGFDEKLETGEDYDISIRAKAAGIKLIDDVRLRVIHEGYPKGLAEFAKREYWHGLGDATSIAALTRSKVAVVALMFMMLHFALLLPFFIFNLIVKSVILTCIAGIVIGSATLKYRAEPLPTILINSFIYYIYFWARSFSSLTLLRIRKIKKRTR